MRLLTWNLSDLDVTAPTMLEDPRVGYLAAKKCDVLCLQKVSGEVAPRLVGDGLSRLAAHLGMGAALGRAAGQRLHVAVLWREPVSQREAIVQRADGSRRNYLLVDLEWCGRRLRVGSVHLPSTNVDDQLHDVALLLPSVDADTVLAGDWNATGADRSYDRSSLAGDDGRVAARLDAAGSVDGAVAAGAVWEPTWRTPDDPRFVVRIDAVRLSSALGGRISGYWVHTDADLLSLHRPVELRLDAGAG